MFDSGLYVSSLAFYPYQHTRFNASLRGLWHPTVSSMSYYKLIFFREIWCVVGGGTVSFDESELSSNELFVQFWFVVRFVVSLIVFECLWINTSLRNGVLES